MKRVLRVALAGCSLLVVLDACGSRSGLLSSQTRFVDADEPRAGSGGISAMGGASGRANGGMSGGKAGGSARGGATGSAGNRAIGGSGGKALAGAAGKAGGVGEGGAAGVGGTLVNEGGVGGEPESRCGDGVVQDAEQCDDANELSGDGCSVKCRWEPVALSLAYNHQCALGKNGKLKCWGSNGDGALGLADKQDRGGKPSDMGDNLPAVDVGTGRHVTSVATGYVSTCAVLDDGSLKCWGLNNSGQLGLGDTQDRGDDAGEMGDALPTVDLGKGRTATQVVCGFEYTCALLDNGSVKCWGANSAGQLGLGNQANYGNLPNQMGDKLPAVALGTGRTAKAISNLSSTSTCALLDNGQLKCWGYNQDGRLGVGEKINHGDVPGTMGDALLAVQLGSGRKAVALATGAYPSCALLDDASIKCWGSDYAGDLGLGAAGDRGGQPSDMGDDLPAVQLGSGRKPVAVSAGVTAGYAIFDDGALKAWGANGFGQLGYGDRVNRGDSASSMGDNLPVVDVGSGKRVKQVAGGWASTCALLTDGTVKCWGYNGFGGLGVGDGVNRGEKPGQMGDALPAIDLTF